MRQPPARPRPRPTPGTSSGSGTGVTARATAAPIDNVLIDGCSTGFSLSGGNFDIRHVTVTGASSRGISASSSWKGSFLNSIFFANSQTQRGVPVERFRFSNGAFDGQNGNIVADPLFRDAPNGDFRLTATSPCVDSGDPATIVAADLAGFPRPQDGDGDSTFDCDIGAIEVPEPSFALGLAVASGALACVRRRRRSRPARRSGRSRDRA